MISVIIATKGRPDKLGRCVRSVLRATQPGDEILIVDQDGTGTMRNIHAPVFDGRVRLFAVTTGGKSAALNHGLWHARGSITAFTDDDCIVSKNWLHAIRTVLETRPSVAAVYGTTAPYEPTRIRGTICPSVFMKHTSQTYSRPVYHAKHIGFGNNMAVRTAVLRALGGFRTWLGPGSIGSNAEDADVCMRLFAAGHAVRYDRSIRVRHDRWIGGREIRRLACSYACGEAACYGFHALRGSAVARTVLRTSLEKILIDIVRIGRIRHALPVFLWFLYGLFVAAAMHVRNSLVRMETESGSDMIRAAHG